ncbi:MAG: hypothetical protein ACI86L_001196 [Dokdonia sp.]|jgi:hypothetical protein
MEKEIKHLAIQLEGLTKSYNQSKCTQCFIMQHYFKRDYNRLKMKLKSLENLTTSNVSMQKISLVDVQQATGVLGMYVMV